MASSLFRIACNGYLSYEPIFLLRGVGRGVEGLLARDALPLLGFLGGSAGELSGEGGGGRSSGCCRASISASTSLRERIYPSPTFNSVISAITSLRACLFMH